MKPVRNLATVFIALSASLLPAAAQYQPAQASVRAVHGSATCAIGGNSQPLQENATLTAGMTIQTAPDTTLDLFLPDSRTVIRLMPGSVLRFDRLDKAPAGDVPVTLTRLSLLSGTLIGSQHKLARPSEFEIELPNGVAKIVGTEYSARSDGTVVCLSGTVSVAYNSHDKKPSASVAVPAGYSSDPATGQTVATSPTYLKNITSDVKAVQKNDKDFNAGHSNPPANDHCSDHMSPTHGHGDGDGHGDGHGDDGHGGDDHGGGNGHGGGDDHGGGDGHGGGNGHGNGH